MKYSKHSIDFKNLAVKLYSHYGSLRKAVVAGGMAAGECGSWGRCDDDTVLAQ